MGDEGDVDDEKKLEEEIDKEIAKLSYFLEETDELIELRDYTEIENIKKRAEKIINKLSDIVAQVEESKLDHGVSPRAVRQWKKDVKSKYSSLVESKEKLERVIKSKQELL